MIEYRTKGYGSEAVGLMMNHGFNNLGLNRIWANTLELNIGAQRLLERLGFSKEGCSRKAVYFAGRYFDKLHYGFLRDEYNDI